MWSTYILAAQIDDVLEQLHRNGSRSRIIAGASDLLLEIERGARQDIDVLIDVSLIPGAANISLDENGWIHLGPLVTHADCIASSLLREKAYPLVKACWEVGSPQIRNRGTIAGNIITGSPANDSITPLMALGSKLILQSQQGRREIALSEFYTGVRRTVIKPDEMLVDISFPALEESQRSIFVKFALRKAQAISLVNIAIVLRLTGDTIYDPIVTLGAVAPTIMRSYQVEQYLAGKKLDESVINEAANLAMLSINPISDVRGSAKYRKVITRVITQRALQAISTGANRLGLPENPVLLQTHNQTSHNLTQSIVFNEEFSEIHTTINNRPYTFKNCHQKSLLRMLREDAGLIGTKEGCTEGECGSCSVVLDGKVVMSCLVPAPRANNASIKTIEGYDYQGEFNSVQSAFIEEGAVQCGYCTPGFIVSASQLLEEYPHPTREQIEQALTGNLCRCTGYYKIINAIELAAQRGGE